MALTFGGKRRPGGFGPRTPLDPLEQALTDRLAAVMRALGNSVDVAAYAAAIRDLDPDRLERLLAEVNIGTLASRLDDVLRNVVISGGSAEAAKIIRETPLPSPTPASMLEYPGERLPSGIIVPPGLAPRPTPEVGFQVGPDIDRGPDGRIRDTRMFEFIDRRATDYAQTRAASLVRQVDESNRLAIRRIIGQAFTEPATVDQTARKLRSVVGLHSRWAQAVLTADDKTYRAFLRDGVSQEDARAKTDVLMKRYRDRLIRRRAEMIARTEIMSASNFGRQAAWDAGNRVGYVDGASLKEWSTAPVGSQYGPPCEVCMENRGKRVPWNGAFASGHAFPPAHPHCRCTAVLVPPTRGLQGMPSQEPEKWLEAMDAMDAEFA